MEIEVAKENIKKAIEEFSEKDKVDFDAINIHELTISHRIAVYLEKYFSPYHIDCEYSKHYMVNDLGNNKKMISLNTDKEKAIRPDIIIHKDRGSDADNLAIIEIKKCGKDAKGAIIDREKIKSCLDGTLGYRLGVFIGVLKRRIDIVWLTRGSSGNIEELSEIL